MEDTNLTVKTKILRRRKKTPLFRRCRGLLVSGADYPWHRQPQTVSIISKSGDTTGLYISSPRRHKNKTNQQEQQQNKGGDSAGLYISSPRRHKNKKQTKQRQITSCNKGATFIPTPHLRLKRVRGSKLCGQSKGSEWKVPT